MVRLKPLKDQIKIAILWRYPAVMQCNGVHLSPTDLAEILLRKFFLPIQSQSIHTVDHEILLEKLKMYGVTGLEHDWFTSYLDNRKQFCRINGSSSDVKQFFIMDRILNGL